MTTGDYFFLIFIGTIAITRLFLIKKVAAPTIRGFRLRHYMYGLVFIAASLLLKNLELFAIGAGLFIDELPVILAKGPGHKDEHWRGCEDYHTRWSFAWVLIFIVLVFIFRDAVVGLI